MKKFIIAVILLALLGGAAWFLKDKLPASGTLEKNSGPPTTQVIRRNIDRSVDVSGFVEPFLSTEVKSEVSGKILEILVENGSLVKKGEKLVVLDETLARADYNEAERNLELQQSSLVKAERDFKRLEKLHTGGFATERDLLDAETTLTSAKISVYVQQDRISKMKENLSKTTILAPHDGIVTNLDVNPGQVVIGAGSVNSGTTLLKVNDLSQLIVQANLNEFDVAKIDPATQVNLTFDSIPNARVTGKLTFISPAGISTSSSGSSSGSSVSLSTALRVFPIKVSFSAGDLTIRPGISANISMMISSVKNALAVPISAVFVEDSERFVYIQNPDGTFKKKSVKTGINNDGYIEIIEGVAENDTVSLIRPARK